MNDKEKEIIEPKDEDIEVDVAIPEAPLKGKKPISKVKKWILITLGAIIFVVAGVIGLELATNNYKTPIKTMEKYLNAEEYTLRDYVIDFDGGLARKQIKQIFKVWRNSDDFLDFEEEFFDVSIKDYERALDKYGENFKVTYTILGYDELTKSDLRDLRADLQDQVYDIEEYLDETEEYSTSDWGDVARELGLLKSEAKELVEYMRALTEEYGRITVSNGYTVSVLVTTTGDALDEPIEEEEEVVVCRVNGKWVSAKYFGAMMDLLWDVA